MENWHYREGVTLQGKEAVEMHIDSKVLSSAHLQNQTISPQDQQHFSNWNQKKFLSHRTKSFGRSQEYKNYPIVTVVEHKHRTQVSVPPRTTKGDLRNATFCVLIPNQKDQKITQPHLTGISPLHVVWHSELSFRIKTKIRINRLRILLFFSIHGDRSSKKYLF